MKCLTDSQFKKALEYLKTYANDIDLAMFEYYFECKPIDEVVKILSSYQNDDGGFGMLNGGTESAYKLTNWIDTPQHPYFPMYRNHVINNLEYLIDI